MIPGVVHKGAVDLQNVEGEVSQVAERRVARAEVVDGESDAEFVQIAKDRGRLLDVLHERALRDFEFQVLGCESALGQCPQGGRCGVALDELVGREVDGEAESGKARVLPHLDLSTRRPQDPGAYFSDEALALGDRNELGARDFSQFVVLPAQ